MSVFMGSVQFYPTVFLLLKYLEIIKNREDNAYGEVKTDNAAKNAENGEKTDDKACYNVSNYVNKDVNDESTDILLCLECQGKNLLKSSHFINLLKE